MTSFRENYDITKVAFVLENLDTFLGVGITETYKKQVKQFLHKIILENGELDISYKYAKYTRYGRRYSTGIQNIKKEIRNFLLAGTNIKDYDISSCHPCILYYLCVKHKIHTEKQLLKNYVFHKKEVIENHFMLELHAGTDIKKLILTATNSDEPLHSKNEWIIEYQKEMEFIRDELKKVKDYKKILQDTEKVKQDVHNENSSFVNRVLCKIESEIIDKFSSIRNKDVFALMFDGLLIRNEDELLLEQYNYFIKKQYGDYFNVVEKPIITDVDMGDFIYTKEKEREILEDCSEAEAKLKILIADYNPIKIIHPALYGIKKKDGNYEFYKKDSFIQSLEHITFKGKDELSPIPVVLKWLAECVDKHNTFDTITTDPAYKGDDLFNLWSDWDINNWEGEWTEDKEAVDYMRNHIKLLCNHDEVIAKEIEKFISHLLKYPQNKSFVPIFVGKQGAGKDMFFGWIEEILGKTKKYESCSPEQDVWGTFNPFMKSAFLVHLSEFGRQNTSAYVGKIKSITTSEQITINEKNKGQYVIPSFHRFIGASNVPEPIPIESDNRRYLIIVTSPDKKGDHEYFTKGWDYKKNKNALMSMYKYFMSLDTPEQLLYHNIDEAEYMKYLKFISIPHEELFLKDFCKKHEGKGGETSIFKTLDLYKKYEKWCKKTKQSYTMEKRKFLIQLKFTCSQTTKYIKPVRLADGVYCEFEWLKIREEGRYIQDACIQYDNLFNEEENYSSEE